MHDGVFLSLGVFQFFEDDCAAFFLLARDWNVLWQHAAAIYRFILAAAD